MKSQLLFSVLLCGLFSFQFTNAQSVVTTSYFSNDFSGSTINDVNQTVLKNNAVTHTQQNGILDIYAANEFPAWARYYLTTLTNSKTIDISAEDAQKVGNVKFTIGEEFGDSEVGLSFRIWDADNVRLKIESSYGKGTYDLTLDFADPTVGVEPYNGDNTFDYTRVNRFEIMSLVNKNGAGHIYLDYLKIGKELGDIPSGIEENLKQNCIYTIDNQLYLSSNVFAKGSKVHIYKITGELYFTTQISENPVTLEPGIFIVKVSDVNKPIIQKIISK